MVPPIVDASFLAAHPEAVLCDVRWYLDGRDGRAGFEERHLPGAIWVDIEGDLADHGQPPAAGRHPLPSPAAFAASMSALGIGDDSVVVAYDDSGGATAGRLVVMLRLLGRDAALLSGGLDGWQGATETGPARTPAPASFTTVPWPADRLADAEETAALALDPAAVVIDARAHDRFTGERTMVDPRPGHIPGAANSPWGDALDERGFVRSPAELREHFHALGADRADDVVVYCGSGVSACINVLAMEHAGLRPPRLYVASWSGWSSDSARPAATGA